MEGLLVIVYESITDKGLNLEKLKKIWYEILKLI